MELSGKIGYYYYATTPKTHQNHPKYTIMATFLKRGKTWRAQITKKVGEAIIRRSGTFPTKSQSVAWALETESALVGLKRVGVTGVTVARNQGMTVQEVIERYMEEVAPLHKGSAREITALQKILREQTWLTVMPLSEVTHGDVARFRDLRLRYGVNGARRRKTRPRACGNRRSPRAGRSVSRQTLLIGLRMRSGCFRPSALPCGSIRSA